jgi:hypothetical protein
MHPQHTNKVELADYYSTITQTTQVDSFPQDGARVTESKAR